MSSGQDDIRDVLDISVLCQGNVLYTCWLLNYTVHLHLLWPVKDKTSGKYMGKYMSRKVNTLIRTPDFLFLLSFKLLYREFINLLIEPSNSKQLR